MTRAAPALTAILTRPAGQSAGLAVRLAEAGIATFEFPLIEIVPLDDQAAAPLATALGALSDYALVVFVSPNAIDQAFARLAGHWPVDVPVAVVGPGSVAALARHGVEAPRYRVIAPGVPGASHTSTPPGGSAVPTVPADTAPAAAIAAPALPPGVSTDTLPPSRGDRTAETPPRYDSEALHAALDVAFDDPAHWQGKRVLIVRGDGGREWLAERLREAGAQIEAVAAYQRRVPAPTPAAWQHLRELMATPHAWLLTSSEGVRNLETLARTVFNETQWREIQHTPCVVPHPRISGIAREIGFDRITQSGAGEEGMVRAFRTLADEAVHATQIASVPSNMTTTNDNPSPTYSSSTTSAKPARSGGTAVLWLALVVVVAAAAAGGTVLERQVRQLGHDNSALVTQMNDLRARTEQSNAQVMQSGTQISMLAGKLADTQSAEQTLQQQYQDLAKNHDAVVLQQVGQSVTGASQQLQLTGNTQAALLMLQGADQQLAPLQSPQALVVRKALEGDIEKLKATPVVDLSGTAIKLDDAISRIDALPLAGEARVIMKTPAPDVVTQAPGESRAQYWWQRFQAAASAELKGLVQVRRIDNADAMLASPEQGYFLRENIKLRLLSARLSLLSRNESAMKADLHAAQDSLNHYFDGGAQGTKTVEDLLNQIDAAPVSVTVPDLSASLNAIQQVQSQNRG